MSLNLGINVREVDGRATPSIQAAPTSVTAFVIRSQRGVKGAVRRVTNWTQFTEHFGGYLDGAYGAYAVRGFFDNGGGTAYVTRIVTDAAKSSTKTFNNGDGAALTVTAGSRGHEDPGAWGDGVSVRIAENPDLVGTYDLSVRLNGSDVESWERLNHADKTATPDAPGRYPNDVINDSRTGSRYIRVQAPEGVTGNPAATEGTAFVPLEGGEDGGAVAGAALTNMVKKALEGFDVEDVQLVCCPESGSEASIKAGLEYCEKRRDCMYLGHTPEDQDASSAKQHGKKLQGNKRYGAAYFPWILVNDPIGTTKWVPPTGHIAGMYARTERERGIWKAPAGNAALIRGALGVKHRLTDTDHSDLVKSGSVNAVRSMPGQGIVVDSSRTLSTNALWLYVNVRLLFNFVKSSLKTGLRWTVQEPNTEELWNKVKYNSVTPFLMGLWRRGAFGPGAPEDVFTVKVDAENNPPANIQQGILTVEVYFYPSRPAETIVITVGQQEGGATASEA